MTRWAKDVSPEKAHPDYPRPQMVRKEWLNLNGLWDYAIEPAEPPRRRPIQGKILVPFPVESALSGVMKRVDEAAALVSPHLPSPRGWQDQRVLLHFQAVDWEATVRLNGKELGTHRGGYDAFTLDVTDALKPSGPQELVVVVFDPTSSGGQPRGKQVNKPGGIMYTPTTGIWQTVWLEPVPAAQIDRWVLTPDVDGSCLRLSVEGGRRRRRRRSRPSPAAARPKLGRGDRPCRKRNPAAAAQGPDQALVARRAVPLRPRRHAPAG